MTLYLVAQTREWISEDQVQWDFQGIFSTEEKAIAACRNWDYCYMPVKLDEELPDERYIPDGWIYPLAGN